MPVGGPTRKQQGPSFLVVNPRGVRPHGHVGKWKEGGLFIDRFRKRGESYLMEYTRSSGFAVVLCTTGGAPLNTASIVSGAFISCVRFLGTLRDSTVAICAEI